MAENSKIQWTDHSVNFWTGCKKVSPGCKYCYMYRDQERYGNEPTDVLKVSQSTINKVLRVAKPGDKIFTCSWSDFFIEEADAWRTWAWDIIRNNPQYNWQILTKRPERVLECLPADWGNGWPQVWLGVSVETQTEANDRILTLCRIPAKVKFLSVEPILGRVSFLSASASWDFEGHPWRNEPILYGIDWVIIGGESGNNVGKYRYRPSALYWYTNLVHECNAVGTPVFVKQLGTYLSKQLGLKDRHAGDISEFPHYLQVRQFPE